MTYFELSIFAYDVGPMDLDGNLNKVGFMKDTYSKSKNL